jgi:hypothetical protein
MSEYDPHVAAALDRVLPPTLEAGDWARVLRDAEASGSKRQLAALLAAARRRRALAFAAICLLATLVTVPALAVTKGWWFLDFGGPPPQSKVVVVESGVSAEGRWVMTAYLSESHGLCVALTMERPSSTGAQSCGAPVRGVPDASGGKAPRHWLGYTYTSGDAATPAFVFGPAAAAVERVDIFLADGTTESVDTIAAPQGLGLPLRFFVTEVGTQTRVQAVVARSASGKALERLEIGSIPQTTITSSNG